MLCMITELENFGIMKQSKNTCLEKDRVGFMKTNSNDNKKVLSKQLLSLRIAAGISQKDLAVQIAQIMNKPNFRLANISDWETGKRIPREKYLHALAKIYHIEPEYFIQDKLDDIPFTLKRMLPKKLLITPNENLSFYDGEPIWCEYSELNKKPEWAIIDGNNRVLRFKDGNILPFSNIDFRIYHAPTPFLYGCTPYSVPLTVEEIKNMDNVWVEMIGGDYIDRQRVKGWYYYNKEINAVERKQKNRICRALPLTSYGETWCAYKNSVDYLS